VNDTNRRIPTVACDEVGCASPATVVVGQGRRRFGRQRLDQVRLLCADHASRAVRRPLFRLPIDEWLSTDLAPFQRRWHRPAELETYLRSERGR
jgi:hypothetical protein